MQYKFRVLSILAKPCQSPATTYLNLEDSDSFVGIGDNAVNDIVTFLAPVYSLNMTPINFIPENYIEIRRRGVALHSKVFKKLTDEDYKTCAKHLGIWHNKQVVIEGDEELDLFTDYCIYAYRPKSFNMAERYLRLFSKDADEFERTLLKSMSVARYAIYQVEQTNGIDALDAVDVFSKDRYRIIDHQMAKTAYSGLMLAGYLIELDSFTIQTGGTVLMTRHIMQADEFVNVIDQIENDSLSQFLDEPANGAKLARAVVATAIRLGEAKNFSHKTV